MGQGFPVDCRLAVYGSLAPGRPNHDQLESLGGEWRTGKVRGRLLEQGWGAALGYPGLVLDNECDDVAVQLFESPDLPDHWARLDAFEGDGYRREAVSVQTEAGAFDAFIYVLA